MDMNWIPEDGEEVECGCENCGDAFVTSDENKWCCDACVAACLSYRPQPDRSEDFMRGGF